MPTCNKGNLLMKQLSVHLQFTAKSSNVFSTAKLSKLCKMSKEEAVPPEKLADKLAVENDQLRHEILRLNNQIAYLKTRDAEKKSMLWKKVHDSMSSSGSSQEKHMVHSKFAGKAKAISSQWPTTTRERSPRVPKPPPPRPTCMPLTPKMSGKEASIPLPPPPPPQPLKSRGGLSSSLKRVPEVAELYHFLTRKNAKPNTKASITGISAPTREMIGEIENRSAYLLSVKSDVIAQGEFINFLAREVANAAFREISDVEAFVKWLDGELSYLVDERAVLKHFSHWPEQRADAMREAAFSYRDLKNLETEITSFNDDTQQSTAAALKVMQALQDKLEHRIHSLEKVRESASKRYRDFKIPWQWMLSTGIVTKLKLGSIKLMKVYIKRIVVAVQSNAPSESEGLMLQGVIFAFRVHQFAGGFDEESKQAFQELKKMAAKRYSDPC